MSDVPDQIRQFLPSPLATLGDEQGFSDTRPAARRYFHIDTHSKLVRALQMLADADQIDGEAPARQPNVTGCWMSAPGVQGPPEESLAPQMPRNCRILVLYI
jgi:pyruvate dehydrogenase E1 component